MLNWVSNNNKKNASKKNKNNIHIYFSSHLVLLRELTPMAWNVQPSPLNHASAILLLQNALCFGENRSGRTGTKMRLKWELQLRRLSCKFGAATNSSSKFQCSSTRGHSKEIFKKGDRRATSKGWNILWNNLAATQTLEEDADSWRLTFLPLICRVSFSPLGSQPQTCQPAITMSCCYNTAVIFPNLPLWLPATPINPQLDAHVTDVSGKRKKGRCGF